VPIQPFALDRKEYFARLHRPRIDGIPLRHRLAVDSLPVEGTRRCRTARKTARNKLRDARERKFHLVFPAFSQS